MTMNRIIWHTFGALATLTFTPGFLWMGELLKDPGRYPPFAPWAAGAATILGAIGLLQYAHWYRTATPYRPRFSLKTLFIFVTVAIVALALLLPAFQRAQEPHGSEYWRNRQRIQAE